MNGEFCFQFVASHVSGRQQWEQWEHTCILSFVQDAKQDLVSCTQLEILVPLENLLEHKNVRVQTYANASMYSLLREPIIRCETVPVSVCDQLLV